MKLCEALSDLYILCTDLLAFLPSDFNEVLAALKLALCEFVCIIL